MKELKYTVRFTTPAFLGNAEQQAQWRTPPFKALLRQWWRVASAKDCGYDHARLLATENALFGSASDEDGAGSTRSRVSLRLSEWGAGQLKQWPANEPAVFHGEVGERGRNVGSDLYLGYGPLDYDKNTRSARLGESKSNGLRRTAIDPERESAQLRLRCPEIDADVIAQSLQLAAWFGTLGSRARNGWGALLIEGEGVEPLGNLTKSHALLKRIARPLTACVELDWPHAIGADVDGPFVWTTAPMDSWRKVMTELAKIKIAFRTQFEFSGGEPHREMQQRLVLAYPVTHHNHADLDDNRLANQIRFKVARQGKQFVGIVAHLPCAMPRELMTRLRERDQAFVRDNQVQIWQTVHQVLDDPKNDLKRI